MKKRLAPSVVFVFLLATSLGTNAHPGHDHSHWSSSAVHALLVVAFVGVAAIAGLMISRRNRVKNSLDVGVASHTDILSEDQSEKNNHDA